MIFSGAYLISFLLAALAGPLVLATDLWTCDGSSATKRTVGYYDTNYGGTECGQYPETLVAAGYTHINAAYAWIDPDTFTLAFMTDTDDSIWRRLTALKQTNPGLQVWLSVGGWMMNSPTEATGETFLRLVSGSTIEQNERQDAFIQSLLSVLEEYGFDGVDFDWAHPSSGYGEFLYTLRLKLQSTGYAYGLSCTLPKSSSSQQAFDIGRMQHSVDWFNVMTYDIDDNTLSGNILQAHSNLTDYDEAFSLLAENGVDPAKITLGLALYGSSYIVDDNSCKELGCAAAGLGPPGACDDAPGYMSYDQVLGVVGSPSTTTSSDETAAINLAIFDESTQWMFYDDEATFAKKVNYANSHCIGGLNVWAIDLDRGGHAIAALSASTKQLEKSAQDEPDPTDPLSECQWSECIDIMATCSGQGLGGFNGGQSCQAGCPAGTTESYRTFGTGMCATPSQYRLFCCPNTGRPDSCKVRKDTQKFQTRCVGRCSGSEVKIGTDTSKCLSGWNEICCSRSDALTSMQQCEWTTTCGTTTTCPASKPIWVSSSAYGDGGWPCLGSERKLLCCNEPNPYNDCYWDKGPFGLSDCRGSCSAPYSAIAASSEDCTNGKQVLCCARTEDDSRIANAKDSLYEFLDDRTCPAPTSTISDSTPGIEARDSLSNFPQYDSIRAWTQVMTGLSAFAATMRYAWDFSVGSTSLYSRQIRDLIDAQPDEDPVSVIEQYVCDFEYAAADVRGTEETAAAICELAWNHTEEEETPIIEKRIFHADLDAVNVPTSHGSTRINTGALLSRILDTLDVPFLYSRVIRYHNNRVQAERADGTTGPQQEIDLEVVYDLRRVPDLQERPGIDIFAVFHFHVARMQEYGVDGQASLYAAAHHSHVYHGQRVFNANPNDPDNPAEWRVDYGIESRGPNSENARTPIYSCPPDHFWYPGRPDLNQPTLIQRFGSRLRDQGVFRTDTIQNWDVENGAWTWDETRYQDGREWPNVGQLGGGFSIVADMRPTSDEHWPEYIPSADSNRDRGNRRRRGGRGGRGGLRGG